MEQKRPTKFNQSGDPRYFKEEEIDYVINMIRFRQKEFQKTDMVKPLYNKALYTLECLMEQLMVPHVFDRIALRSVSRFT